jgi:hypothetical protein
VKTKNDVHTKAKTGTLYLIKSKNLPVFRTPMTIRYTHDPVLGESFLFSTTFSNYCNLSETKKLDVYEGFKIIATRNSFYVLTDGKETDNAKS